MMRLHRAVGLVAVLGSLVVFSACDPVSLEERLEVRVVGDQPVVIDTHCGSAPCPSALVALAIEYGETYDPDEDVAFEQYRVDFDLDDADDPPYYAARTSLQLFPGEMVIHPFALTGDAQRDAVAGQALRGPVNGTATVTLAGYAYDNEQVFLRVDVDVELRDVEDATADETEDGADGGVQP